jgi:hypothetical protein
MLQIAGRIVMVAATKQDDKGGGHAWFSHLDTRNQTLAG